MNFESQFAPLSEEPKQPQEIKEIQPDLAFDASDDEMSCDIGKEQEQLSDDISFQKHIAQVRFRREHPFEVTPFFEEEVKEEEILPEEFDCDLKPSTEETVTPGFEELPLIETKGGDIE